MFDRAIIDTDNFMDLSMSGKALYFLLGMEADDEGFVSSRKVMRVHGGNLDDLKVLIAKKFVIPFESGVVVITDWKKNNWLDTRRIRPTEYEKEKKMLVLTESKQYALSNGLATAQPVERSRVERSREEIAALAAKPSKNPLDDETTQSLAEFVTACRSSSRRYINLVGEYADELQLEHSTKGQWQSFLTRNLRPARLLAPYTDEQIEWAMQELNSARGDYLTKWTLETLLKYLEKK